MMRSIAVTLLSFALNLAAFGAAYSPIQNNPINVQDRGIDGTGLSDVTTVLQAAFNAAITNQGGVKLEPYAIYKVSNSITISPYIQIYGFGATITNTSTNFTLVYHSPTMVGAPDLKSTLEIHDLTIRAKYGIQLNAPGDWAAYQMQSVIQGARFINLQLLGAYSSAVDPNSATAVVPTLDELKGYGIGLHLIKVFDSEISGGGLYQSHGIGIYLDRSDVNLVEGNRFNVDARWIQIDEENYWGGKNTIRGNDMLFPRRVGGIFLAAPHMTKIENNFFESYEDSAEFITATNDWGTMIINNRFTNTRETNTFMVNLGPQAELMFHGNMLFSSDPIAPVQVRTNWYSYFHDKLGNWYDNSFQFPDPGTPALMRGPYQHYWFCATNYFDLAGTVEASFPWVRDPFTGNWTITTNNQTMYTRFPIQNPSDRRFRVLMTGRSTGVGLNGFAVFNYIGEGTTNLLWSGSMGFPSTHQTNTAVRELLLTVPTTNTGNGTIELNFYNNEVQLESVKLIPGLNLVGDSDGRVAMNNTMTLSNSAFQVLDLGGTRSGIRSSHYQYPGTISIWQESFSLQAPNTNAPLLGLTRFTGSGTTQHDFLVHQFFDTNVSEWAFGIFGDQKTNGSTYASTLRLSIRPLNGYVGIGGITPVYPLDVDGESRLRGNAIFDVSFQMGGGTYTDDGATLLRNGVPITGSGGVPNTVVNTNTVAVDSIAKFSPNSTNLAAATSADIATALGTVLSNLVRVGGSAPTNLLYVFTPMDTTGTNWQATPLMSLLTNITHVSFGTMTVTNGIYYIGHTNGANYTLFTITNDATGAVVFSALGAGTNATGNTMTFNTDGITQMVISNGVVTFSVDTDVVVDDLIITGFSPGQLGYFKLVSGETNFVPLTLGSGLSIASDILTSSGSSNITDSGYSAVIRNADVSTNLTVGGFRVRGSGASQWLSMEQTNTGTAGNTLGTGAVDLQVGRNGATKIASNNNSFAAGTNLTASGAQSVALGSGGIASGSQAVAMGINGTAQGSASTAMGSGTSAGADFSTAMGLQSSAFSYGMSAHSAGMFAALGDAQSARVVARATMTIATSTVTNLFLNGSSTTLALAANTTWSFRITVAARSTDAGTGDEESAGYIVTGMIERDNTAANTRIEGTPTITVLHEDDAAWDFNISADTTNGALTLTATGNNETTIRWVATVEMTQVGG